jgi:hypothetical protein
MRFSLTTTNGQRRLAIPKENVMLLTTGALIRYVFQGKATLVSSNNRVRESGDSYNGADGL